MTIATSLRYLKRLTDYATNQWNSTSHYYLTRTTTDAVSTPAYINGDTARTLIPVPTGAVWQVIVSAVAADAALTNVKTVRNTFLVKNVLGTVTVTAAADNPLALGVTGTYAANPNNIVVSTTNITINAIGLAATTVNHVVQVDIFNIQNP